MGEALRFVAKIFGAFLSIYAFAVYLETPKKHLIKSGFVGAVSGIVYFLCMGIWKGEVVSSFVSALAVSLVSHIFARKFKTPVTLFLVAGILPIVPGAGMYRTVHYILLNDEAMAAYYMTQTLEIAGVIALAIFIMDSLFRGMSHGEWKQQSMKYVRKVHLK